jgi:hypothetical protein
VTMRHPPNRFSCDVGLAASIAHTVVDVSDQSPRGTSALGDIIFSLYISEVL